jgi:hypothetical protein
METIKDYLQHNYLSVTNSTGNDDQDVEIKKIDNAQPSIWTLFREAEDASASYPQLLKKSFEYKDNTYEIYYLKLRANLETGIAPSRVDEVLAAYKGTYLRYNTEEVEGVDVTTLDATQFEYAPFPTAFTALDGVIRGWTEIFPFFKSGNKVDIAGEPIAYSDFGAGVIFIPSGFGYFNQGRTSPLSGVTIPSYSPLVYTFKLYEVREADQDGDGIFSNDEDLNGDSLFNTDGDNFADLYDADDDGDGYFTINEIKRPNIMVNGESVPNGYYPFHGASEDDPTTENIDERQGIPRKFTGPIDPVTQLPTPLPSDFTDPTRLRRHLDSTSFPPFQ